MPELPHTESGIIRTAKTLAWRSVQAECDLWRSREARGGGIEYHYRLLPRRAQAQIVRRYADRTALAPAAPNVAIEGFVNASNRKKKKAQLKLDALRDVEVLAVEPGMGFTRAVQQVAQTYDVAPSTLYAWRKAVHGVPREHRVGALVDMHFGRTTRAECDDAAWNYVIEQYLKPDQPPFSACWLRLVKVAKLQGWKIPSHDTMLRRIRTDVPVALVEYLRKGPEAWNRLYPAQVRTRDHLRALEAVNADGHKWDVMVRWDDGSIGRPVMVVFQDLYSNLILSLRVDKSENKEMVRLAFADLVQTYGIPRHCYLDNGRAFASKWLTGGIRNRYRFKIREEEPHGILPLLGVEIHRTTPYSGQSKPIERAFGEFAGNYAKHPIFAGSGTGNSPENQPSNYGEHIVPISEFVEIAAAAIHEHNNREGRRTSVCGGRESFQQTFNRSYATATITKATDAHLQILLLAAEGLTVNAKDGSITLKDTMLRNCRYVNDDLHAWRGRRVMVRFDPQKLGEEVRVYTLDGKFITCAKLIGQVQFDYAEAAQDWARAKAIKSKADKKQAEALCVMSRAESLALTKSIQTEPAPAPETKIVRPLFASRGAVARKLDVDADEQLSAVDEAFVRHARAARAARAARGDHLRVIDEEEE